MTIQAAIWCIRVALASIVLVLGALVYDGENSVSADDDSAVVAVVNSERILYSSVRIDTKVATRHFAAATGHAPVSEADLQELKRIRHLLEIRRLREAIRLTVQDLQIARFSIHVTLREVTDRWQEMCSDEDPPSTVTTRRNKFEALLSGLRRVYEESKDPDDVYAEHLREQLSRMEWNAALQEFRSTAARQQLYAELQKRKPCELGDAENAVRSMLRAEKLNEAIDKELARSDSEFAAHLRLEKSDAGEASEFGKDPNYRAAKRHEWWQARYSEAKVKILDERFVGAWREPF